MIINNKDKDKALRLHLTNIAGLGATRLLQSLLPAMVSNNNYTLEAVYLPTLVGNSEFAKFSSETSVVNYNRYLPNSISRLLECTLFGYKFNGDSPLLVFGDIPIKCKSKQTVFFQNKLLLRGVKTGNRISGIKFWIARWIFKINTQYVSNFIVQTEEMKRALINSYPETKYRIYVISQPAPIWLIDAQISRTRFNSNPDKGLKLFYPAANYPHKNHQLLTKIDKKNNWPIDELILTISEKINPMSNISWIRCVDKLETDEVLNIYKNADALMYLSFTESFGLPLVEAMWLGLPIICPDLPYARTLCGDQAIYFDPLNIDSLNKAVLELENRRNSGWWPNWKKQLSVIPKDWDTVADMMFDVASN